MAVSKSMETRTRSVSVFSDGLITVSDADLFARVLTDTESPYWGKQPRSAAPAPCVNRTGPIEDNYHDMVRSNFTAPWQWYWVDILSLAVYNRFYNQLTTTQKNYILSKFKGLTTSTAFLNNGHGTDVDNCYPCGRTNVFDPLIDPLICGNDKVKILEIQINSLGKKMARLYGFDVNSTPPPPDLADPRVMIATIISADGHMQNFPHLGGIPVPYPYIQNGPCWYPMSELQVI